uniref:STEAP family member 4 n=1 Tax=Fundulus heteroclitus TaxID=8078 RepID=A0A3Q2PRZ9_FUNHE
MQWTCAFTESNDAEEFQLKRLQKQQWEINKRRICPQTDFECNFFFWISLFANSQTPLFPEWRLPLLIAVGLIYLWIYRFYSQGCFKKNIFQVFPIVALIMLSLCYLPGAIAAFFPLYRGTKYSKIKSVWLWCFPIWLDCWMLCRKQMDVVVLGYAFLHAIYTFIIPIRYAVRHKLILAVVDEVHQDDPNQESWDFFLFVLLGLTSLPSVGGSLSWREFSFIQVRALFEM